MKIATFLSFVFVVCVLSAPVVIVQADEQTAPEFSASFKMAHDTETKNQRKYEKYSVDENGTSTVLIVYNAMVSLLEDNDGDEDYPKMTCKLDLDINKTSDYYAIFYLDFNDGYSWWTADSLKTAVYTLEEGYSPKEGLLYLDIYFISGYEPMKVNIKVEVYYSDGSLVATYGPDDDPDLKNIPIESVDYDAKGDPFATPSPTPTPDDGAKITGYVVNNEGDSIIGAKVIARKEGETIATISSDKNGEFILENLEPGEYGLTVTKKGYRRKVVTVTIEEGGGDEKIVIELKKR